MCLALSALACVSACGAAAPAPIRAPDTAADPLPYTPPPTTEASAGEQVGLIAVDNGNIAIDIVRDFFEAAATGTDAEIQALLSESVTVSFRGRRRSMASSRISRQFQNFRRVRGALAVDSLVDINALEFTSVGTGVSLEADDRAVRVPIGRQGHDILGNALGWTGTTGVVYVRPRLRQIVGF